MNFNKKQKVVKSNTESQETTEFSNNESIETQSDNEESKSDTSEDPSQNFKSIPDGYRPLSKTSASKLGSKVWNYFQPLEHIATGNRGSTRNMWDHLSSIHGITKNSNLKSKDQQKISIMFKTSATNLKRQTKQNQSLVEWIIDSAQALRVVESEKFKVFIANLDPYYELPTLTIAQSNDLQTRKESKRLQQIMLTDSEWNAIKELVIILCPFAEASTYLDASKSSMIGFINPTLSHIKQDLYNKNSILYDLPDLENSDMAFDNEIDEDNEFVILHNHKLNINIPQDCDNLGKKVQATLYKALETYWNSPVDADLLPTLLDPRHKQLKFADSLDRKYAENTLKCMYNNKHNQNFQETSQMASILESYSLDEELSAKSLRKKLLSPPQNNNNDEVKNYLQLSEIDFKELLKLQKYYKVTRSVVIIK
ncbi:16480_t:CDS:2 [Racocetra fulgida]|uniref:16480_t:CDS:1 n=2 Tax=Racocetra TaxID=940663 RepID=A0A9N8YYH4_9GLOM|nr:16480_t:CDS:2 [Racocetra fulgida]